MFIQSPASRIIFPGTTAYTAARWGVRGLVEALRQDLRYTNVEVLEVTFGAVASDFFKADPSAFTDRAPGISKLIPPLSIQAAGQHCLQAYLSKADGYVAPAPVAALMAAESFIPGVHALVQALFNLTGWGVSVTSTKHSGGGGAVEVQVQPAMSGIVPLEAATGRGDDSLIEAGMPHSARPRVADEPPATDREARTGRSATDSTPDSTQRADAYEFQPPGSPTRESTAEHSGTSRHVPTDQGGNDPADPSRTSKKKETGGAWVVTGGHSSVSDSSGAASGWTVVQGTGKPGGLSGHRAREDQEAATSPEDAASPRSFRM